MIDGFKDAAIIVFLVIRDSDNRNVIRVLTLALDTRNGNVVVVVRVFFVLGSRAAVLSPNPGSQIAVFNKLALKQLQKKETSPSQVRNLN